LENRKKGHVNKNLCINNLTHDFVFSAMRIASAFSACVAGKTINSNSNLDALIHAEELTITHHKQKTSSSMSRRCITSLLDSETKECAEKSGRSSMLAISVELNPIFWAGTGWKMRRILPAISVVILYLSLLPEACTNAPVAPSHKVPNHELPIDKLSLREDLSKELRTCKNCHERYAPTENSPKSCRYHSGFFSGETRQRWQDPGKLYLVYARAIFFM
jgi:hypothetical protein